MGAITALGLAWVLYTEGLRMQRVQALMLNAISLTGRTDEAARAHQIAFLEAAGQLAPAWGRVQTRLAREHLSRFEERQAQLARGRQEVEAAQLVLNGAPASPQNALAQGWYAPRGAIAGAAWDAAVQKDRVENARQHLVPALQAYLQARDVCPLMAEPHVRLAANAPYLQKADPRTAYLDRAKRIVTNDAELWFLFGVQELLDGNTVGTAQSWHRSLEVSDQYLMTILELSKNMLRPETVLNDVLPARPHILVKAAVHLYPQAESAAQRRPFFEKALAALQTQEVLTSKDFYLQAHVQAALGQVDDALTSYRHALALEPQEFSWRLEHAQLLLATGKLDEARQELMTILRQNPNQPQARQLLEAVREGLRKR
jgi:tetratricopeptide (TPR) repeat protein